MITITTDATSIISALLGGASREIFFESSYKFITTEFTIYEIKKYLNYISQKSGVGIRDLIEALDILPIEIYKEYSYSDKIGEATNMIEKIDKKDINILALCLKNSKIIWSEDKHFEKVKGIIVIKTKDFLWYHAIDNSGGYMTN